jgi:hypothetical protein
LNFEELKKSIEIYNAFRSRISKIEVDLLSLIKESLIKKFTSDYLRDEVLDLYFREDLLLESLLKKKLIFSYTDQYIIEHNIMIDFSKIEDNDFSEDVEKCIISLIPRIEAVLCLRI